MNTPNHTNSTWVKYFYSGVGFVAHSKDIVQKSVDEFVKNGKVNEADGKKIVDSAIQKLEASYNEAIHKLSDLSSGEMAKLKGRIDKLEKQLLVKTPAKKSANRSLPRKKVARKSATR